MPADFYLLCGVIVFAAGVLVCTVWALERWLAKADKLPRPVRVRKIRKRYEPLAPRQWKVYPDGREETS